MRCAGVISRAPITSSPARFWTSGDIDGAIESFRTSIDQQPENPDAYYSLGLTLARRGEYAEAIEAYRKAIEQRGGNHPWAYHNLGMALLRRGDFDEAVRAFNSAIEQRNGEFPKAWHHLGVALARRGDLEQAAAALRKAIDQRHGSYPETQFELGHVLFEKGDLTGAVEAFRAAIAQRRARFPQAHFELGRALFGLGRLEKRSTELRAATRRAAHYPEAHHALGRALAGKAISRKPSSHTDGDQSSAAISLGLITISGVALARQGNLDEAVASYRKAIEQNPRFPRAHYDLGLALYNMGDAEARPKNSARQSSLRGGSYPDAYYELGRIYTGRSET